MPASYINLAGASTILENTSYSRTREGLDRLIESRTCLTSSVPSLLDTYANGTVHPAYSNMLVELTDFSPLQGGFSKITVTYVGLLGSSLPRPIIDLQPLEIGQFLHNRVSVNFRVLETGTDDEIITRWTGSLPSSPYRGVSFYQSKREPYSDISKSGFFTLYYGMLSTGCFLERFGKYVIVSAKFQDKFQIGQAQGGGAPSTSQFSQSGQAQF